MTGRFRKSKNAQTSNKALRPADPSAERESKATVWSAVFAGFSLLALMASIIVSIHSAQLTGQQNNNAQQQELVTLVTDIVQGQQGSSPTNGSGISAELAQLGEAEEANNIINGLPPSDVSSVEIYIVGRGLELGDDYQLALLLFAKVEQKGPDPSTAADAWRSAAAISYQLGLTSRAEGYINLAKESFNGPHVLGSRSSKESDIAFTDLFDVYYQIYYQAPSDCSTAINEWNEAAGLIKENKNLLSGPNDTTTEENARNALAYTCHVPLVTLKKEIPFQAEPPQPGNAG
jgi:hypothetical protein